MQALAQLPASPRLVRPADSGRQLLLASLLLGSPAALVGQRARALSGNLLALGQLPAKVRLASPVGLAQLLASLHLVSPVGLAQQPASLHLGSPVALAQPPASLLLVSLVGLAQQQASLRLANPAALVQQPASLYLVRPAALAQQHSRVADLGRLASNLLLAAAAPSAAVHSGKPHTHPLRPCQCCAAQCIPSTACLFSLLVRGAGPPDEPPVQNINSRFAPSLPCVLQRLLLCRQPGGGGFGAFGGGSPATAPKPSGGAMWQPRK